jgi:FkbM family methyltransferase
MTPGISTLKSVSELPKAIARRIIKQTPFRLIRAEKMELLERSGLWELCNRWAFPEVPIKLQEMVLKNINISKGQLSQDVWAPYLYLEKYGATAKPGYFVEFGATDGILRSNSYLLEKEYGWNGILCEPARAFHELLTSNRTVSIDFRCVYSKTGESVEFHEVESLELSGLSKFKHIGGWEKERSKFNSYKVETISLQDLLISYSAPKTINYMSIDTEGSEFEILRNFDFSKWNIETLSIEHNFSDNESKIDDLLSSFGYERQLKTTSGWDAWYVLKK